MNFFFIIWSNLWRRPTRSVLTAAGVAIGVAAGVAMAGISLGFSAQLKEVYTTRGADVIITRLSNRKTLPTLFEQTRASSVAAMPGVSSVAGVVCAMLSIDGATTMVNGWEPDSFLWEHLTPIEGQFMPSMENNNCIYLGIISADTLGKKVGDTVEVESHIMRVAAIYDSGSFIENGSAILALPALQSITGNEGKINMINVRLEPHLSETQFDQLRQTIQRRFRGLKAFRVEEIVQNSVGIQTAEAMCIATTSIALLIGTLGMMNTLLMSVFERTREIGLLMAVGWSRRRVMTMILMESVLLSIAGAMAGVIGGILCVRFMQTMDFMQGKIHGEFTASLITTAFAIAAGLGIVGGIYPAARAAFMQPCAALRTE